MKTFFYSRQPAYCRSDCLYYTCPRRCLYQLRRLPVLDDMVVISGSFDYLMPQDACPRYGDIIIIFAATWHELEELIAMSEKFEQLKVILINDIRSNANEEYKLHQLQPRYIAALDSPNLQGLGEVVSKIRGQSEIAV